MKLRYILTIAAVTSLVLSLNSCNDFLDQDPDTVLTDDQVFNDPVMIKSVLANFYGRMDGWGQSTNDSYGMTILDEAARCDGGPDTRTTFEDDRWRVYDYGFIRNLNQFLAGIRATTVLEESEQKRLEGETRFLRAWTYFCMGRGLGGMPLVGDEIFTYPGMDIEDMQIPRSTEAELYDYIISECSEVADMLPTEPTTNAARATKWAALMLEARAALYAGSLANYNNKMPSPIKTDGGEVGIPADRAYGYYQTALESATAVINSGTYTLMTDAKDPGLAFANALNVKTGNTEVIWSRDYKYPGKTVEFTKLNIPASHAEDIDRCYSGPILNLVEAFEYVNDRNGALKIQKTNGEYVFYDKPEDVFANKDARLWGTVIYPGADFKGTEVVLQAGQLIKQDGKWTTLISTQDSKDENGLTITALNGPIANNNQYINKTGFFYRKFLDETPLASTRGRNSDLWWPYFRIAEAYMIACEASFELENQADAVKYINVIRNRASIQPLESVTLEDIVQENRVEFAFEDHRYWDLKRWRLADKVWNGVINDPNAQQWALYPYRVNAPGDPADGKWVFIKQQINTEPYPRYFQMKNYYNFVDLNWVNNNPKFVKNPYQ